MFGLMGKKKPPVLKPTYVHDIGGHVIALSYASDGRIFAAASADGPVVVFDSKSGKKLHVLAGHKVGTFTAVWQPESTILASTGQDGKVRLWNATGGHPIAEMDGGAAWVEKAAWSSDGKWLATAAGKKLKLWSSAGNLVRNYPDHSSTIADICWTEKTGELISAAYGCVNVWNPERDVAVKTFQWQGSILVLAFSPSGKFLAAGGQDSTVHFWIVESGDDMQMSGYPHKVRELSWDCTGRYLATGGGPGPCVWDCSGNGPANTQPYQFDAHDGSVTALAFSPKEEVLASCGSDGLISFWRVVRGSRPAAMTGFEKAVSSFAWHPSGKSFVAGAEDGKIAIFDLDR